ncbi:disease resistance protein RML1B [Brassica rapa]|uniref:disease resistance protein RML1B n=1 Tax=Brassica campestris TaxID=3711 RepID=UPI00142E3F6E|nr:disease resistance protein RML1B [Brassica rapa]
MASSSSLPQTWRYRVFTSFHGPDVRKTLLSHVRKQLSCNGISMFDDQWIERSQTIAPALTQAIRESRISIVVLSKKYASSSWCLDELVEILKCKESMGQIVMTVFYGVDPSHVRNQTRDFGIAFDETCQGKTEEKMRIWRQALTNVGNIAGEHFLNWDNESMMIEKIARDVSNKLNTRISRDFEDMVGIETHLKKLQSLLHLDDEEEAMIVGICGPAGIGKTTIARALHSRFSNSFQLTCFMENVRGSCNSGLDEYGLKMHLQENLLSKILNQNSMKVYHLGAIQERLCDLKVLIVLDDVDDLKKLEALADETRWFGPGSRIIVTTEDQEILEQHGISNTYHVDFPTREEARQIFSRFAFRQSYPPYNFGRLVERVTKLCSSLPLGLRVMGSSLRGKKENEWEVILNRLENSLCQDIERVLKVGYDNLHENDQSLFLHIACFFNLKKDDYVMAMLSDGNLDVRLGLKTLAYKSLIEISTKGEVVMHKLLQQMGSQVVQRQEPWKRQILIDAHEICDVLETDSGSRSVTGICYDTSTIQDDVYIRAGAFKRMRNLRFLSIYKTRFDRKDRVHVPEDMDFPSRLRLLHWVAYPRKCLPHTFCPEYLVELNMPENELEKLWEGPQPLTNLKRMNLNGSKHLKEFPDLSNATNLERLFLDNCESLVEIPCSIGSLHKLKYLYMANCLNLQHGPTHCNLASLEVFQLIGSRNLRKIPDLSTNVKILLVTDTMLEEVPDSFRHWSRLRSLCIYSCVPTLEKLPEFIKYLHGLKVLGLQNLRKLASLPELPGSLTRLTVVSSVLLETVPFSFDSTIEILSFPNCFKLGREARRVITTIALHAFLPGSKMPAEFDHRAIGNSLIIRSDFKRFRICVVISLKEKMEKDVPKLLCRIGINDCYVEKLLLQGPPRLETEHMLISSFDLLDKDGWLQQDNEISFEFSATYLEIIECGVQILVDKTD